MAASLLGLHGPKGVGKDTACGFVSEWASTRGISVSRRGFADALKLSFARLFIPDIAPEEAVAWCDELKQDSTLSVAWQRVDDAYTETTITHRISGRQALQRFGTEGHRNVFGDDFWIDALLPVRDDWIKNFRPMLGPEPDIAVVTDVRFPNEAERIKELGGLIWRLEGRTTSPDIHLSEMPLPPGYIDRTIVNDDSLAELNYKVIVAADEDFPL